MQYSMIPTKVLITLLAKSHDSPSNSELIRAGLRKVMPYLRVHIYYHCEIRSQEAILLVVLGT